MSYTEKEVGCLSAPLGKARLRLDRHRMITCLEAKGCLSARTRSCKWNGYHYDEVASQIREGWRRRL